MASRAARCARTARKRAISELADHGEADAICGDHGHDGPHAGEEGARVPGGRRLDLLRGEHGDIDCRSGQQANGAAEEERAERNIVTAGEMPAPEASVKDDAPDQVTCDFDACAPRQ